MDKRKLHHYWTKIRPVSPWYFLILAVISGAISIYALRENNLTMIRLREAVIQADEQNGDVEKALRELREHVHTHMNTNLASGPGAIKPPIQLKHRYDRLAQAEKERAAAVNGRIYTEAQAVCERQVPTGLSGGGRIPCIEQYVTQQGGVKPQPIPDDLYKFDFVSPSWSPDLAGWSLMATAIFGILFIFRWGMERVIRSQL
jgi:hypothetical protein